MRGTNPSNLSKIRRGGASKVALASASSLLALTAFGLAHAADRPVDEAIATASALNAPTEAEPQAGGQRAAESSVVEQVIITGLRGSLQRNLDIKRASPGVVDAISAEDIGKFPDANVAASLQRLPGVSIQRSGSRGEPQGITVRGFGGDFNETLYDGRRISTATGGRSVDFSTVGADFVGVSASTRRPTSRCRAARSGPRSTSPSQSPSTSRAAGWLSPRRARCRTTPERSCPPSARCSATRSPTTSSAFWSMACTRATTPRPTASMSAAGPAATTRRAS